jgi:hypothetical protein
MENEKLFHEILKRLYSTGVLEDIILIGGWCLPIYRKYFDNSVMIPIKKTQDVDFLIHNPPKIKHKVDIGKILKEFGFEEIYNRMNNFSKFSHADLDVEFLMNQKGKGENLYREVKELGVKAVQLRYLSLAESNTMKTDYQGIKLTVPDPAAYTLHKYIVSKRRLKPEKAAKDMETAKDLTDFLLTREDQRIKLKEIFSGMPDGWQKTLLKILKEEHQVLYDFLNNRSK